MLCKKCKTAVNEDDKVCKYCGNNLKKNNNIIIVIICLIVLAIIVAFYLQKNKKDNIIEVPSVTDTPTAEPSVEPTTDPGSLPTETPVVNETTKPSEEPIPSVEPDLTKSIEEVAAIVDNISKAADEYIEKYSEQISYLSKNGYLYELASKSYVKLADLLDLTEFNPENKDARALLLYLKPDDLQGIKDFHVKPSSEFEVFATYETKDGYFMSSTNNAGGIISKEDLEKVLDKYLINQGKIVQVLKKDADYNEIIEELKATTSETNGFDVRSINKNDKYCVAVVSPLGKATQINEFVLQKIEGKWKVVESNFETISKYRLEINKKLVDLDFDLLPEYNMSSYSKYIVTDFAQVIKVMKDEVKVITDADLPVVFSSGTDDFVYLEFTSGKKFVGGLSKENVWVMYPVQDYDQAFTIMTSIKEDAPTFILKQE